VSRTCACWLSDRFGLVLTPTHRSLERWTAKLSATAIDVVAGTAIDVVAGTTGCVPEKRNQLDVSFALSSLT